MPIEFDFVGSTVVCEVCRHEFELQENDLFRCENCQLEKGKDNG